ncbi:MAG: T9SS type A sorting domain-containing protein [Bacteroidetes bacterium]|nr:T9SS type A sorting domain-containing protein [Bacteroidota bacterium]
MKYYFLSMLTILFCVTITAQIKLIPDDGSAGDFFGAAGAIYGNYAIFSSIFDDDNGTSSGSAYVFKKTGETWIQESKLTPDEGVAGDWFFIGALYEDYAIGMAGISGPDRIYIFKRTGTSWTQEAKLIPDDCVTSDFFHDAAFDGNYAIIGSCWDDVNGAKSGSAYVFKRTGTTWTQEAKLTPDDGNAGDWFGNIVAINGEYVAISAPYNNQQGAVYIFKRTGETWIQEAKLIASDGIAQDGFGVSLEMHGDLLVAGAPGESADKNGFVCVYKRTGTTWIQEAKLIPDDGAAGDQFGVRIAINEDCIIIGAEFDDDNGENSGSAYVFTSEGTTWTQHRKISPDDGMEGDRFGRDVVIYDNEVFIGAPGDNNGSGSVYVYPIDQLLPTPVYLISLESDLFNIYPNPAKNNVRITNSWESEIGYVALYDQSGKQLLQRQLTDNFLDISNYSAGIYFLEAKIGDKKTVKKLIIQ